MMQIYNNIEQGTNEWLNLRLGIVTASCMQNLLTAQFAIADNETSRNYMYELIAEIFTGEPKVGFKNEDTIRGTVDEPYARNSYNERHGLEIEEVGFITNSFNGGLIGYSPDGLVSDDGLVEFKNCGAKMHVKTIIEQIVPSKFVAQIQTGLLVTGRKWIDFVMRCDGLPDFEKRVYPDAKLHETIIKAVQTLYEKIEINKNKLMEKI